MDTYCKHMHHYYHKLSYKLQKLPRSLLSKRPKKSEALPAIINSSATMAALETFRTLSC